MQASDLRNTISFQSATTSSDSMGGRVASEWVTDRTTRAKIISNGADVSYENGQTRGIKTYTIITRYLQDYDITKEVRVKWGSVYLTPNVPVNVDILKKWMTFEAKEFTD